MLEKSVSFQCLCLKAHVRSSSLPAFFLEAVEEGNLGREGGIYILEESTSSKHTTRNVVFSFTHSVLFCQKRKGRNKPLLLSSLCPSAPFHPFFFFVCLISLGCSWSDEKNSCQKNSGLGNDPQRLEKRDLKAILGLCISMSCVLFCLSVSTFLALPCESPRPCLTSTHPSIHPPMSLGMRLCCTKVPDWDKSGGGDGVSLPRLCYSRGV